MADHRREICPTCGRPLDDDLEISVEWSSAQTDVDPATRVMRDSNLTLAIDDEPYASIEIGRPGERARAEK